MGGSPNAIHDALKEVDSQLEANETLFAHLDDVSVVIYPERTRPVYDLLGHHLQSMAFSFMRKTRVWNRVGQCPDEVEDLGEEVWSPKGEGCCGVVAQMALCVGLRTLSRCPSLVGCHQALIGRFPC